MDVAIASSSLSPETDRESFVAADEVRSDVLPRTGDLVLGEPRQHLFEEDAAFEARERRSETEMLAESEREVRRGHRPKRVEPIRGRAERGLVAVAAGVEHQQV